MRADSLRSRRPLWLMTLADLSLLLVGFFVFVQATARHDAPRRAALAAGIRDAFGGAAGPAAPIAVDANRLTGFTPGSAALPDMRGVAAWLGEAARDPRSHVEVTGYADPSEGLALAAARADAAAQALGLGPDRARLTATVQPGARQVLLSISFDPVR
jgi:flagellar motor protein MotB